MKKIFWKCIESSVIAFEVGREYEYKNGILNGLNLTEFGIEHPCAYWKFRPIEREVFEVRGKEWFRHTPGDPMPCDATHKIFAMMKCGDLCNMGNKIEANKIGWGKKSYIGAEIIGWCYSDQEIKPEGKQPEFPKTVYLCPNSAMTSMDTSPLDGPNANQEAGENRYAEKKAEIKKSEEERDTAQAKHMEELGRALTREHGSLNDHRFSPWK